MLKILAFGSLLGTLNLTYDNVLVSKGKTLIVAILNAIQVVIQVAAMLLGAAWGGEQGVIIGLAAVSWLIYPFKAFWLRRVGLWQPELDLPVIALASALVALVVFVF